LTQEVQVMSTEHLSTFRRLDFGLRALLLVAMMFASAACGGGYGGGSGSSSMGGLSAPTITAQPMSVSVAVGQTAMFSVTATGAAGYQWLRNGNIRRDRRQLHDTCVDGGR
jgi:hypothetical protein